MNTFTLTTGMLFVAIVISGLLVVFACFARQDNTYDLTGKIVKRTEQHSRNLDYAYDLLAEIKNEIKELDKRIRYLEQIANVLDKIKEADDITGD